MMEEKDADIADIFKKMSYGAAPEDDSVVQEWLEKHDRRFGHFINNEWVIRDDVNTHTSVNPATGIVLATICEADKKDVRLAVTSANEAFKTWSQVSAHERAKFLYSLARHVQKHQRLLSVLETVENGKPIRETRDVDVPTVVRHLYHFAGWAQLADTDLVRFKPLGVVCAIVPWNFPLMLLVWKLGTALATGNTLVLKPAPDTSLSALLLAEICAECGLPPGVFNIVTGSGSVGSMLAGHADVAKVAFTGSTQVGKLLRRLTAGSGKRLSLELGGKSPVIVFDSADIDSAVEGVVDAIWFNQGQVCSAGSKLLIQESIYDRFIGLLTARMLQLRVGDSLDKCVDMAAIINATQRDTIAGYVQTARDEGAHVFQVDIGSKSAGCYYPPTLITDVQTVSKVVTDEIFGPVAVALPFRTAKEAIALANDTRYGLAASVWTEHVSLALEVAMAIAAGTVWVNAHNMFDAAAGFGGFKQSGYGRDAGFEGLLEYLQLAWCQQTTKPKEALDDSFGKVIPQDSQIPFCSKDSEDGVPPCGVDRTYKLFYGGAQKRPDGQYSRTVVGHAGCVLAQVASANRKDIRNAVEAANKASAGWSKRSGHVRAQIMYYIAENLECRRSEFEAQLIEATGCSQAESAREVENSIERMFYWAAYADKYGGNVQETTLYGVTVKIHAPVGVIGIVCPKDSPLLSFVSLICPALVRGNCVVVVPSDTHPLSALDMCQIFETSDVPAGVINVLSGHCDHLTRFLAQHHDVQAVWYFGTQRGSQFVEHASADNVKRTWVDHGEKRDWDSTEQGQGHEFLYHSVQVKNIWLPMGDIFAN